MRAFVAVELPDEPRKALSDVTALLRSEAKGLSWVSPERWHITLTFLGEVDELTMSRLSSRLERAARRTSTFELQLGAGGRFGHRVLYAKVTQGHDQLIRLAERTTAAARREGLEVSDASRQPHVTLARARIHTDLRSLAAALTDLHTPAWRVVDLTVVQSVLGPKPRYKTIERFPLEQSSA